MTGDLKLILAAIIKPPEIPIPKPYPFIRYQFGLSVYLIYVSNPEHISRHVHHILVDGHLVDSSLIPLVDDQKEHHISVTLG